MISKCPSAETDLSVYSIVNVMLNGVVVVNEIVCDARMHSTPVALDGYHIEDEVGIDEGMTYKR